MVDMFDAAMDAVQKFSDGCGKVTERMDALEKRRADAGDGKNYKSFYESANKHASLSAYHSKTAYGHALKGQDSEAKNHSAAANLHSQAANHYYNAIQENNSNRKGTHLEKAHEIGQKAHSASSEL